MVAATFVAKLSKNVGRDWGTVWAAKAAQELHLKRLDAGKFRALVFKTAGLAH